MSFCSFYQAFLERPFWFGLFWVLAFLDHYLGKNATY